VAARATRMAVEGAVTAVDGSRVSSVVRSICVHGDTPGAVQLAKRVRSALESAGLTVAPFA
jgi:UPF0271 protein